MKTSILIAGGSLLVALVLLVGVVFAEEVTVTTYYPSPEGKYKKLETTDQTLLATDTTSSTANVGIGTATPATKLDVNGDVTVRGVLKNKDGFKGAGVQTFPTVQELHTYQPLIDVAYIKSGNINASQLLYIYGACHRSCCARGYSGGFMGELNGPGLTTECTCF